MARKVKWLTFAVIFVILGWSALWYAGSYAASRAITEIEQRSAARGDAVTCADPEVGGYPFRIEVSCDGAVVESNRRGLAAAVQAVRTVALLYKPGHVIAELEGPFTLSLPATAAVTGEATGNWESARASVNAGISGLKRASFSGEQMVLDLDRIAGQNLLEAMQLANVQLHTRSNPETPEHFDVVASAKGVELTRRDRPLPAMDFSLDARADNVGEAIDYNAAVLVQNWLDAGGALELHAAQFDSLGLTVKASGPLTVSPAGLVSGSLKVSLNGLEKLPDLAEAIAPRLRPQAQNVANTLRGMAAASVAEEGYEMSLDVAIRNGVVTLGILPLGRIPALF